MIKTMPGKIMTAAKTKTEYGFKSIKRSGDQVKIRNSAGKTVTVGAGANVYHRGNGNFGIYSAARDQARHSKGSSRGNRVGTGANRQTRI